MAKECMQPYSGFVKKIAETGYYGLIEVKDYDQNGVIFYYDTGNGLKVGDEVQFHVVPKWDIYGMKDLPLAINVTHIINEIGFASPNGKGRVVGTTTTNLFSIEKLEQNENPRTMTTIDVQENAYRETESSDWGPSPLPEGKPRPVNFESSNRRIDLTKMIMYYLSTADGTGTNPTNNVE